MESTSPESSPGRSTAPEGSGFWRITPELLLWIFALAAPWSIAYAQTPVIAGAVLLLVGVAAGKLTYPRPSRVLLLVGVFLVCQAISIPLGVHPARSLRCFRGSWVMLFPFVFWELARDPVVRRRAFGALVISGALAGLYGAVQHFAGVDYIHRRALEYYGGGGYLAVGNLNSHLTYAGVLLPVFFLALGIWLERPRRLVWASAAFLLGLGILFSYTRTVWVGAAGGLALFGILVGRRAFLAASGAFAAIVAVAAAIEPALRTRILSIFQIADDPRSRLWRTAWRIVADHPLFGAGLGSFKTQFPIYRVPGQYLSTVHPHSDPLNVLVETGILGGVAWLVLWVVFFRETRRIRSISPLIGQRTLDGLRAGVAALLIAGLGQCFATDEEVAQVWWFVVAAGLWQARELAARAGEQAFPEVGTRRRSLWRTLQRRFKDMTLPLAARILAPDPKRAATPERILVVRSDNRLGNLLLMTPFLQRLREAAPRAHIAFLSGEAYAPLLRGWPWIDEWIVQEKRRHAVFPWLFPAWIAKVRAAGWDLAFEASNPNTHSYYNCILALASAAPERIGFAHPRSAGVLTTAVPAPPERTHFSLAPLDLVRAQGWSAAAAPINCPLAGKPSDALTRWKEQSGLDEPPLLLHLGGRDQKAWPLESWAALLPRLLEECDSPIVLIAGPEDQDRLRALLRRPSPRLLRAPKLALLDLAHLLRGAAAFVGCDSGVMHLGVSLGTPTVAIFFRSNPYQYAPLGTEHRTVLLANPYGVKDEEWTRPVEGLRRSPLLRAERDPENSRRGNPETGPRALEAIATAVRELTRGGRADTDGGDALAVRLFRSDPAEAAAKEGR